MMRILPKLCALSFTSLTLARLSIHPGHPVNDARRWTLEDNNQATRERFRPIRRQPRPATHGLEKRAGPETVDEVWRYLDDDANSDSSSDLQSSYTPFNNFSPLARRASVAASSSRLRSSDAVADSHSPLAGLDDPIESDIDPDTNTNTNRISRAITTGATPTPTATSASSHSSSISVTTTSASAQATHARGTVTSSSNIPSHATAAATVPPSPGPSASSDSPTSVNIFQHLGSYFQPSSNAFPAAIMIAIAAGILILLTIISVAKCVCHKPKFANAKDYPQGFPWDPHHNGVSELNKTGKKGMSRAAETQQKRTRSSLDSWKSDCLPFDPSHEVVALPQVDFQHEAKPFTHLRYSKGSGPSLVIPHGSEVVDLHSQSFVR